MLWYNMARQQCIALYLQGNTMEHNEISLHQVKVYQYVAAGQRWMTNKDIAQGAGVAPRTARQHTKALVNLGIFDQAEVFPSHAYRLSDKAKQRNTAYLLRLQKAEEVLADLGHTIDVSSQPSRQQEHQ
jgi:DNA-binding IclR family transcriptional regulator